MHSLLNETTDPWDSTTRSLRPIVCNKLGSNNLILVGAAGDISQPVAVTTLWANPSNHAITYRNQREWILEIRDQSLSMQFLFPAQASFLVGLSGTIQSGTVQMDIELLDAMSTILTSASMLVTYVVNCTSFTSFDYNLTLNSQTQGTQSIAQWNALRVRSTCSNTNLNLLLNYGSSGSSSDPSASILYPPSSTVMQKAVGIG